MVFEWIIISVVQLLIIFVSFHYGHYKGYGKGFDDCFNYILDYLQGMELNDVSEEVSRNARYK